MLSVSSVLQVSLTQFLIALSTDQTIPMGKSRMKSSLIMLCVLFLGLILDSVTANNASSKPSDNKVSTLCLC